MSRVVSDTYEDGLSAKCADERNCFYVESGETGQALSREMVRGAARLHVRETGHQVELTDVKRTTLRLVG